MAQAPASSKKQHGKSSSDGQQRRDGSQSHQGQQSGNNKPHHLRRVVLFQIPISKTATGYPHPHPRSYKDISDIFHVIMPCSDNIFLPSSGGSGGTSIGSSRANYWSTIRHIFGPGEKIESVKDLTKAVSKYNPDAVKDSHYFSGLEKCVQSCMGSANREKFFKKILPAIQELALKLRDVVTHPLPLMKAGSSMALSLSQRQVSCLLANAFLCTFPNRNGSGKYKERSPYPDINFDQLFEAPPQSEPIARRYQKLLAILNYFKRVTKRYPTGTLTILRHNAKGITQGDWKRSRTFILKEVNITSQGSIEENGTGMLQVDFANKHIGGGALNIGQSQEATKFLQYPELLVAKLVCEKMNDDEAILVIGAEKYSQSKGQSKTFEWGGNCDDQSPRDSFERRASYLVAIDAMDFSKDSSADRQFEIKSVLRELNKALAGFSAIQQDRLGSRAVTGVATGNWGCGAFKGDPELKFLIQLMAVSETEHKKVSYFTLKNDAQAEEFKDIHRFLVDNSVTVGLLFRALEKFKPGGQLALYPFLKKTFGNTLSSINGANAAAAEGSSQSQAAPAAEGSSALGANEE